MNTASLDRHLNRPSPRNFRAVLDLLLELEPDELARYGLPYVEERLQDWPATQSRTSPDELRENVRAAGLAKLLFPPDLVALGIDPVETDVHDLAGELDRLGVSRITTSSSADELDALHSESAVVEGQRLIVHHGDLTLAGGTVPEDRWLIVTGDLRLESDAEVSGKVSVGGEFITSPS